MAILTTSGRTAMAIAIAAQPLHLAWGSGDAAWDATPVPEPVGATALVQEIGRRTASLIQYCTPDAQGELVVPAGRYAISASPTQHLYLRFNFDFTDASASLIREAGVFLGTVLQSGLPEGQRYFAPADIASPGTLLALERFPKITRSASVRQSFEFVLTL